MCKHAYSELVKSTIQMKDFVEILEGSISTDVGVYVPIKRRIKICLM